MILLDAMMQLYRANYKLSDLVTRNGRPTGMEFGFLKSLEALTRYFKDEIIICWEGRNNFRYKIDKEYKANRREKRNKDAHKFLTLDRINSFKSLLSMVAENAVDDELEADDIMASLALKYAEKEKVIIYSGDKDMFQVLQKKPFPIFQCRTFQHRERLWTPVRVEKELYGLKPNQLSMYYAFIGDPVDNIKGANRVRKPLIAAAILDGYGPENLSVFELFSSREIYELEEFYDTGQYAKNLKLVTLKIKDNIKVEERNWQPEKIAKWLDNMEFRTLKLCQKCGLEHTIREDEEF